MANSTTASPVLPATGSGDAPAERQRSKLLLRLSRLGLWDAVALAAVCVMLFLIVYPFARSIVWVLFKDGTFDGSAFQRLFTSPVFWDAVKSTAIILVFAVPLAILISSLFAWLNERTNARMGIVATIVPIIPILIPGVAMAIGWKFLAEEQVGYLNTLVLRPLLGLFGADVTSGPLNVNSYPGVIAVYTFELIPFAFLLMTGALRGLDPAYEEASRTNGASAMRTFWKVSLPAIRPTMLSATLLCFMIGAGMYAIPAVLGGQAGIHVVSVLIANAVRATYPPALDLALAGSIFLGFFAAILWYAERQVRRRSRYARIGGRQATHTLVDLGAWRYPARGLMVLVMVLVGVLPMLALLLVSVSRFWSGSLDADFTLFNYQRVLDSDFLVSAFRNSLILAVGGATLGVALAALASSFMARHPRGASAIDGIWKAPGVLTNVSIAVGFIIALGGRPFSLGGTWQILLLAYLVIFAAHAIIAVGAAYDRLGTELTEASAISGAAPHRTFFRVQLPLMVPGMTAGWTLLFVYMFSEVTASVLLSSPRLPVVGFVILNSVQLGEYGYVAALTLLAALVKILVAGPVLAARRLRVSSWRRGRRPAKPGVETEDIPARLVNSTSA